MDVPSQHSRHSRYKNIEDYSNSQDIHSDVEALKTENFNLLLKTEVLERYLRKRCPSLLIPVDRLTDQSVRSTLLSLTSCPSPRRPSLTLSAAVSESSRYSPSPSSSKGHHSLPHSSIVSSYRISPLIMIDMIDRELDESKITMDKLRRRFGSAQFLLETEEENVRTDIKALEESKMVLENFIKQNTDKKSGRIFHDRFLRFIDTEIQNEDRHLRKLKLKAKSTQIEYNRLLARQEQRLELRERLHPVDMEKLNIENEELLEKLEHKTRIALDLKKTVGKKGQALVAMKSKLNDALLLLRNLKQEIKQKELKYKFTEEKEIKNVNELITAEFVNENVKRLNSAFKSPDAHNYLRLEVQLSELKGEREKYERRMNYQRQSIMMLEHQLKQMSPPARSKGVSSMSYRTSRSTVSLKSTDTLMRRITRSTMKPHGTPTTPGPGVRHW